MLNYRVLLYYHYVNIEYPQEIRERQRELCQSLNLKGRIIIANEGINGTLSGTIEETEAYQKAMANDPLFANMPFKIDVYGQHAFKKLSVKVKPELVNLSLEHDVDPLSVTGKHLKPKDFLEAMEAEDTIVIDARNDYEYDLGHFRGAVRPEIKNFRDLPDWIRENKAKFQDKKILTYCTGGVRCEKFSGWLIQEGFEDVSQLDGGIAMYGVDEATRGKHWDGLMYVFDERISVPINHHEHTIIGIDYFDGTPSERYVNCANPSCNRQMLCSEENEHRYMRSCSHTCCLAVNNRYVVQYHLNEKQVLEKASLFLNQE